MFDHSPRKANIGLLAFVIVLALGILIVGRDASDASYQVVVVCSYAAGFTTLFWLYHREDRARERAQESSDEKTQSQLS